MGKTLDLSNMRNSNSSAAQESDRNKSPGHLIGEEFLEYDGLESLDDIHDDIFVKFVKNYYFPFILRFHKHILVIWLAAFAVCIVFGPAFLTMTKSSLESRFTSRCTFDKSN